MHVNLSIDSVEKMDAAMLIIELLITSVIVSLVILYDKSFYDLLFML